MARKKNSLSAFDNALNKLGYDGDVTDPVSNMDEDDMARFVSSSYRNCPFFRNGDEYKVVRHQM